MKENLKNQIKAVIWDWNGTLLNDLDICIQSMNPLLEARKLPGLTANRYKDIFTFPVQVYYEKLGFDFDREPFDIPAMEFMDNYHALLHKSQLFPDVLPALNYLKDEGYRLFVLSAMEQESLVKTINQHKIDTYFEQVVGIENHFAHGKIHRGKDLLASLDLLPEQFLLVGDTLHDKEVADVLGCSCVLVAQGHQAKDRLAKNGNEVLKNLDELQKLL